MEQFLGLLRWFTEMENTKPFVLVLFFVTFVGILIYVLGGRKRGKHLESAKYVIFEEDGGLEPGQRQKEDAKDGKE
ncbi:MAG: cbb3-type cytochrome oxidase subunit 3 [Pseudomonadota bacterium]|uniref:cbb3-type cytochrome oxidase subunit 3 n=1 Tax=Thermithiobacillus tepidarius TaxID=929 RepID=UPI000425677C|nr:cbb3-type cytochrome c oxidase subunit 3 [Thermithiobacillus tepidarius]